MKKNFCRRRQSPLSCVLSIKSVVPFSLDFFFVLRRKKESELEFCQSDSGRKPIFVLTPLFFLSRQNLSWKVCARTLARIISKFYSPCPGDREKGRSFKSKGKVEHYIWSSHKTKSGWIYGSTMVFFLTKNALNGT